MNDRKWEYLSLHGNPMNGYAYQPEQHPQSVTAAHKSSQQSINCSSKECAHAHTHMHMPPALAPQLPPPPPRPRTPARTRTLTETHAHTPDKRWPLDPWMQASRCSATLYRTDGALWPAHAINAAAICTRTTANQLVAVNRVRVCIC